MSDVSTTRTSIDVSNTRTSIVLGGLEEDKAPHRKM